jgi:hypothetical protein
MSRYLPLVLVPVLVCTALVRGDDARPAQAPPLESRVGRTITVVEGQKATDKATITHVWRLADGSPVMQARSLATGLQLTLVENTKATGNMERIKVHRWTRDGVAPAGCPMMPMPVARPATPPAAPMTVAKTDKVVTTEGGLMPVMPKKEDPRTITTVAATKPAAPPVAAKVETKPAPAPVAAKVETKPAPVAAKVETKPTPVATPAPVAAKVETKPAPVAMKAEAKPMPTAMTPAAPAMKPATPAPIQTVQATAQPRPVAAPISAPMPPPGVAGRPHMIGGAEVITVTENGKPRQFKVIGTARDAGGMMLQRAQALDNGQIILLNCAGGCVTPCVTPQPCPPVIVRETKPCPPPVVVKQAPPAPVAQAPAPKMETVKPTPAPVAAPCPPAVACQQPACNSCNDKGCDGCGKVAREKKWRTAKDVAMIDVPVPGVMLNAAGGFPSGPPPQPLIPSFCSANSSSVRAALCMGPLVPFKCMYQPFTPPMNALICNGITMAANDPVEGEAIKNTLYLINVLQSSREWENRQWAADRLQMAQLPQIKPYVEDCLMSAAQYDRAPHVKATAIRTLVQMRSMRPDLMGLLAQSMASGDPMVMQAAGKAIETLMKGNVQQAAMPK